MLCDVFCLRIMKTMNIAQIHKEFLEHLEIEKGRSLKTVENYDRYIKRFLMFARIDSPADITEDVVRRYRLWLNRFKDEHGQEL